MRRSLLALLAAATLAQAGYEYDDYPVAEYDYPHHSLTYSPVTLIGGLDNSKAAEGIKVDVNFIPDIDIQTLRYEYTAGADGTFGFGPMLDIHLQQRDSLKFNAFAGGAFFRYYLGLGRGSYIQFNAEYFRSLEFDYHVSPTGPTKVTIGGPQLSPILGYKWLFSKRWILDLNIGFTAGYYETKYSPNGPTGSETEKNKKDFGGYYFSQLGFGYAW